MFGQTQLENPGFENNWSTTGVSGSEPEPGEWSGLKSSDDGFLAAFAPITAFQETTNPHSGTYCIRLTVSSTSNANGLLTNGQVHADFNPENGFVFTNTDDPIWHFTFTDRPDSLTFWVRHTPEPGDKSKVEVVMHDSSHVVGPNDENTGQLPHDGTTSHWVGKARAEITGDITNWQRVSVPFIYYNTNAPKYILATLSAGDSTIATPGTDMWVDDIELIYNPLIVVVDPPATQTLDACVAGTPLTATETTNAAVLTTITREWKWSNNTGGPYSSFGTPETGTSYTPLFTTPGSYFIVCETDYGSQGIITSNEVEITINAGSGDVVSISPTTAQNINEAQNGNVLIAVECPTATARDWKWTTTSGSGYQSFGPVETNTTYTPNFGTAGTYYVICESDFAGNMSNSNEVTIIVAPAGTGIDEQGIKFKIFNTGTFVQVEYEGNSDNALIELYSLDGKQVYNSNISNGTSQHNVDVSNGIYVYRMIDGDKIVTGQINL